MKHVIFLSLMVSSFVASAVLPRLVEDSVVMDKNALGSPVAISYELADAPAVVTFSIETNACSDGTGAWTALPRDMLSVADGDINRRVEPGRHAFIWNPRGLFDVVVRKRGARAVVRAWPVTAPPDWMVVDCEVANDIRYYETTDEFPNGYGDPAYKDSKLVMRRIPAAGNTFRMGSPTWESGRNATAEVPHDVSFTNDFYLGVYEVTCGQWYKLNRTASSSVVTNPINWVSYQSIRGTSADWPSQGRETVGGWLKTARQNTGVLLDLPTEAEWEYVCRAGTRDAYNVNGLGQNDLGWFNGSGSYKPVGLKPANAWGFHDMHGNVYEFCLDWYEDSISDGSPVVEPTGSTSSSVTKRAVRGGSWGGNGNGRSASRAGIDPAGGTREYGFRVWAPSYAN